jgi:Protein of unknown function (DUF2852)
MSCVAARIGDLPRPLWIALMILGFALWWPAGLAILGYLLWSGTMGCWHHGRRGRWGREEARERTERWLGGGSRSSGNRAFDDYRSETLKRLEEEQREFRAFLDRLRLAKDKAEFDEFLAEQRKRAPDAPPEGAR